MNVQPQSLAETGAAPSFDRILEGLSHPVLAVDQSGVIQYANAAAEGALGGWVVGLTLRDVFPGTPLVLSSLDAEVASVLTAKDDLSYDALITSLGEGQFALSLRLQRATKGEGEFAERDDLTGAVKRNGFMNELVCALNRGTGEETTLAVHCLDLDRFKMVNDTLGHAVGDLLLKSVAERIASACRKDDVVGRVGGDEFVILQKGIRGEADAEKLAARLVDLVGRTYVLNGHTVNIGASVGVALAGERQQARDMLRNGDLALYEAKRAGRGRYRLFQSGMVASLRERREMEIDLRRALALKQFQLHYQPFIDLTTDRVIGFEALLRWKHPVRGNVPPLSFISLAEENGLIVKIGEWVLRTACMAAAGWPNEMIVAVNVSPLQFKADTLLQTVSSALQASGLPAHRLEIEITEGALLDDTDNVLETLTALRALGVSVSMDDFGTGYSSLSYLQKFPFSKIKIDRSFVAGTDPDSEAILKAVTSLGISLGMAITAEGVETAEQLHRIRGERCTHVQGYFTGRPMAPEMIPAFLDPSQRTERTRP